jgi:hypothetical protein
MGQNNCTTTGISYVKRIAKWWGEMVASRWRRGDGGLPRCGDKLREKGKLRPAGCFYWWRGERGVVVPHIGDMMPVSGRTGGATPHTGFPCCESLTGGPRSGFEPWCKSEEVSGCTNHRPGPLTRFSYFSKLN